MVDLLDNERWEAHRREHFIEATAEQRALEIATNTVDRRLDGMNELRAQLSTERGFYMGRPEFEAKHDQLGQRIDQQGVQILQRYEQLTTRIQALETQQANVIGRLAIIAGLASFAVSLVATFILKALNI